MLVRGENWEVINHQWTRFCLGFLLEFLIVNKEPKALRIQCDSKPEFVCKGNKRITQKMETVMAGCSVQVQCTFTWVELITRQPLLKCWLSKKACMQQPICVPLRFLNYRICFGVFLGSCTLHLVWREGGWAEFWCSTMQVQYFKDHAKCIHFTGIYSMLSIKTGWEVHNDIQLISKKKRSSNVLLSATAIWQKKKTKKVLWSTC